MGMVVRGQENLFGPFFAFPALLCLLKLTPPSTTTTGMPHFSACNPEWSGARPSASLLRMPLVTTSGRLQMKTLSVDHSLPLLIHAHTRTHSQEDEGKGNQAGSQVGKGEMSIVGPKIAFPFYR